jgi:hypothetical protein
MRTFSISFSRNQRLAWRVYHGRGVREATYENSHRIPITLPSEKRIIPLWDDGAICGSAEKGVTVQGGYGTLALAAIFWQEDPRGATFSIGFVDIAI